MVICIRTYKRLNWSSHDVGEGGILIAIAEMCIAGNQSLTIQIQNFHMASILRISHAI